MRIRNRAIAVVALWAALLASACTRSPQSSITFTVSMEDPASRTFHVTARYMSFIDEEIDFKMPNWTPGYYSLMDYFRGVESFEAYDSADNPLGWEKASDTTWRVSTDSTPLVRLEFDIRTSRMFIANSYIDENRAFISPTSAFMYITDRIDHPATVTIEPYREWPDIATGLDRVEEQENTFTAPDFDVLFDSPILVGDLESLPPFEVQGIPHRFIGYELGDFDKVAFMDDLKKIVETAVGIIGDIPYRHYTFMGVGPGRGGLEHLNSTAISFSGSRGISTGTLGFIAHEYFHHYNVKRIRPIELGPFDYDNGNPTTMLWVAEGFTSYYQNLILRRAGLMTTEELLDAMRSSIIGYENTAGRLYQSVTESSLASWTQGPFGGDRSRSVNYYSKGAALGMLLDFEIRHASNNERSLDDVMRTLYRTYYQTEERGFTEEEFRLVCEEAAGVPLDRVFEYASTTREIDYGWYLSLAGLDITVPENRTEEPLQGEALEAAFRITVTENPTALQSAILRSWIGEE